MINKIILHGRICTDISMKQINNEINIANFRMAVKRNYKNQNDEYDTDFFNCSAYGNIAKILNNFYKNGQEILITGHLQNRSWETDSGEKRYATDVIVETTEFCGSKKQDSFQAQNDMPINIVENGDKGDDLPF